MHSRPLLKSRVGSSVLACALVTTTASADPTSLTGRYSAYEEQAIRDAATDLGTGIEPLPEGKTIERIDFVRLDPIDRQDRARETNPANDPGRSQTRGLVIASLMKRRGGCDG